MRKFYLLIISTILIMIGLAKLMPIIKSSCYLIDKYGSYQPNPQFFFCPQNFGLSNYGLAVFVNILLILVVWFITLWRIKSPADLGKLTLGVGVVMSLLIIYTWLYANRLWGLSDAHGLDSLGLIFYFISEVGLFLFTVINFIFGYYILKKNAGYISAKVVLFVDLIALMMALSILNIF